jgi:hypothetical protein
MRIKSIKKSNEKRVVSYSCVTGEPSPVMFELKQCFEEKSDWWVGQQPEIFNNFKESSDQTEFHGLSMQREKSESVIFGCLVKIVSICYRKLPGSLQVLGVISIISVILRIRSEPILT